MRGVVDGFGVQNGRDAVCGVVGDRRGAEMLPRSFTARARKGELRMKKFLLLFAGALMLLSGCSTSEIGDAR